VGAAVGTLVGFDAAVVVSVGAGLVSVLDVGF
jgi:hypothetical protein